MTDRLSCPGRRHGTYVAYQKYGCRCDDARDDMRLYLKRRRERRAQPRRFPSLGYVRRIRGLQAIGWPLRELARLGGLSYWTVREMPRHPWVSADTARRVKLLWGYFYDVDGPSTVERFGVLSTEWRAWLAGYPPPGAWGEQDIDDPAAVPQVWGRPGGPDAVAAELAVAGRVRFTDLSTAERLQAYRVAAARGLSHRRMGAQWEVSGRVVKELRASA